MILLIHCEIDSDTLIDQEIEWRVNRYIFKLYADAFNYLRGISIECKQLDYETYIPKVVIEDRKLTKVEFPKENFYSEQISMLQYLESFSALDLGVRKIHWERPKISWVPENENERIAISSYQKDLNYTQNDRKITLGWLQNTLAHRGMLGHLTEPLSFYRKGSNCYFRHAYIEAFLNFFMMLEGIFGDGNTKKNHGISAFLKAPNLVYGINQTLETIENQAKRKHSIWFSSYQFSSIDIMNDPVKKMINIFFYERGKLAHYLGLNKERRRNDFEDERYQSLAFLSMSTCHFCSIKLRFDPFRKKL